MPEPHPQPIPPGAEGDHPDAPEAVDPCASKPPNNRAETGKPSVTKRQWLDHNWAAITAWNEYAGQHGIPLAEYRSF